MLVRFARLGLSLGLERVVVAHDTDERSFDGEVFGVLPAKGLGARDGSLLVRDTIASLLLLVVLLDEGNLLAAEGTLEVVDTLRNTRQLLGEILLVFLNLLDLELDEIGGGELGEFLCEEADVSAPRELRRPKNLPQGRP